MVVGGASVGSEMVMDGPRRLQRLWSFKDADLKHMAVKSPALRCETH